MPPLLSFALCSLIRTRGDKVPKFIAYNKLSDLLTRASFSFIFAHEFVGQRFFATKFAMHRDNHLTEERMDLCTATAAYPNSNNLA